jgi:nickel transport protein
VLKATYAGADPVPFAKVQVFSPAGAEFQNANTDKNGAFSFVPDAVGSWRVSIDDELGHRRETVVAIASLETSDARQQPPASRFERALLGLALIFGATGLWYGYRNRSQS